MMSKVVSAAEELPLLVSWLTHLCARRDCSWKKSSRGHSDGSQTDSRGWGMLWICQHLAMAQPSLSSQMIQALSKVGGSPPVTCSMEKPASTLKLLGGSFHISGSPGASGSICFFCHLDFISFSPFPSI